MGCGSSATYQRLSHAQIYKMDVGNAKVRLTVYKERSYHKVLTEIADGTTITVIDRRRFETPGKGMQEWLHITSPVRGNVLYTLDSDVVPFVNARARAANSPFVLVSGEYAPPANTRPANTRIINELTQYTVLSEEPHIRTYKVDLGNLNAQLALRDGPSTTCGLLGEISEGDTITTQTKLRVQAGDGSVQEWMCITSPVRGFAMYTLPSAALPQVNARARAANSPFVPLVFDDELSGGKKSVAKIG